MDALAQVVQRRQVLAPMAVDALQQHHAHEGRELLGADVVDLGLELRVGGGHHLSTMSWSVIECSLDFALEVDLELPLVLEHLLQPGQIPLLFRLSAGT